MNCAQYASRRPVANGEGEHPNGAHCGSRSEGSAFVFVPTATASARHCRGGDVDLMTAGTSSRRETRHCRVLSRAWTPRDALRSDTTARFEMSHEKWLTVDGPLAARRRQADAGLANPESALISFRLEAETREYQTWSGRSRPPSRRASDLHCTGEKAWNRLRPDGISVGRPSWRSSPQ